MRPVRAAQKAGRSRAQVGRRSASPVSRSVARHGTRRSGTHRDGIVARLGSLLGNALAIRRPILMLTGGLALLTIIAALFIGGYVSRATAAIDRGIGNVLAVAGFGISQLHLAGNTRVPPETVLAALGFTPGQSIFSVDVDKARARLMTLDWVADADVRRRFPDDVSVRVVEKVPFALWRGPDKIYVITRDGQRITSAGVDQFAELPHFIGAGAPEKAAELMAAIGQHRAVAARVRIMQRVGERRWNLILDDNVVVQLPEKGWQRELETLEHLIVDKGILERDITQIDLRSKTTYFFLLRNGGKTQIQRGKSA